MAGRTVIAVPYHLDEHLPGLEFVLPPDQVVTADLAPAGGIWDRLAPLQSAVAGAVSAAAADGSCPVVVSGDCFTALGVVAGIQAAGAAAGQASGIVWFDAHGDVQTPETTASGYVAGMPLRLLTGYRPELIAGRLGLRPVPEEHIVLAGARDLDPPEASYLAGSAIRQCDVAGLTAADLPGVPLYVHVDFDVLDPGEVPGVRFPTPGGPTAGELAGALATLLATGRVAAITLACTWYPGSAAAARLSPLIEQALAGGV